ncbi:ATP-binding protein [Streptomyces sp. LX-29]|uniref:uridine kinase family protein n=1 Tax=Streptomyces sp. LX-29 TaxID=2900152 RepID=UPI00240D1D2E|nr:ATP-binding protein [Streptomyces sp. LX-29]WFB11738.1 ATP-binding protein [Streptomyces sp. LX-29]
MTGPSGCGKSSLAARTGLPVLNLDDFYKEADDPSLPQLPGGGGTDWDSPLSWDADAAVAAIESLCATARAAVPVYDIATSSRVGEEFLEIGRTPLFIAEGIFAADIIERCQRLGVLADALCLRGRPGTTFRRRLIRDLREGRKPAGYLVRRGWRLMRAERGIVARQRSLGAHACDRDEAMGRIAAAAAAGRTYAKVKPAATAATGAPATTSVPAPETTATAG